MQLRILIIALLLVVSIILFSSFEFELLPKLGIVGSWTDLTKTVWKLKID